MKIVTIAGLLLSLSITLASAQETWPQMEDVGFRSPFRGLKFDRPLWVGHPGDGSDRLFVAQQDGRIYQFVNTQRVKNVRAELVLDLRGKVRRRHNEEGLLGLAFHPSVVDNGYVYLHYSASHPRRGIIARFSMNADRSKILPESEREILVVEQPWGNHNGGGLAFGPDGYLYVGLGDGGSSNDPRRNAQDLGTLLGTLLRIDVDSGDRSAYLVPPDNPFVENPDARPEIWAYGLRNPWRFSFDSETGDLWAGDVGQDRWEEIDLIVRGGNYGWNRREGSHAFRGGAPSTEFIEPVIDYERRVARSITGGVVYRGQAVPSLQGAYVHADFESGFVWAIWAEDEVVTRHVSLGRSSQVSSFGVDIHGEVYFCSFNGLIYKIAQTVR